ncbi:abnormal spindle-like microcephaly-associated protein homolog [Diachasma alloeum]|uniref:abnormal spindle-like microcephaly-associated protein homolog n=1 Tax=Diachasma alloeum TaxID=454923 RepID=UPI0007382DBB|nr:abnormal spindle-like microcephaly-associated protein homolog [Diachasma alloeum]
MSNTPLEAETMKANSAATKIQANFRGYRVRKQLKENRPPSRQEENGIRDITGGKKALKRQDTKNSLEEKSATKIQAGVRGFLVRKRNQVAQAAATRIQAGFRGFRTRKQLKQTGQ